MLSSWKEKLALSLLEGCWYDGVREIEYLVLTGPDDSRSTVGRECIEEGLSRLVKLVKELKEEPENDMKDWCLERFGEDVKDEDEDESLKSMKKDLEFGDELNGSDSLESG